MFKRRLLVLGFVLICGCFGDGQQPPPPTANVRGERESSSLIDISVPRIQVINESIMISGTIKRQPGVTTPIPGYLYLQIIKPDGSLIDEMALSWNPKDVPLSGESTYSVQYGLVPPDGSTVTVVHGFEEMLAPNAGGSGKGSGSSSGPISPGNSFYTRTPSKPTQPKMPAQPGTPRSGSGGRK